MNTNLKSRDMFDLFNFDSFKNFDEFMKKLDKRLNDGLWKSGYFSINDGSSVKPEDVFKSTKYDKVEEKGEDKDHTWTSETWTSEDGSIKYYKKVSTPKEPAVKEPTVADLEAELTKAVDEQRYEDAIKLRDKIKSKK